MLRIFIQMQPYLVHMDMCLVYFASHTLAIIKAAFRRLHESGQNASGRPPNIVETISDNGAAENPGSLG